MRRCCWGLDFLQAADVDIRARGSIYVQGKCIESKMVLRGVGYVTSPVCLEKSVVLRPNTEHIAWDLVESPIPGKEAVLNPVCLQHDDILVALTLVCMEPRVPVCIANFSDGEVQLRAGLLVGDLMETESAMAAPRQEPRREVDSGTTQGASQVHKLDPLELPGHLQDLYSRATENIGADDAGKLAEVLSSYEDVFAHDEMDLGHFSAVKHCMCTGGAHPVRQPVCRTPLGFKTEEEGHLRKMLDAGIVEPSQSE